MTVRGVLFDFSGTLLRIESAERWLSAVLAEAGVRLPAQEAARYAALLEDAGALPGGAPPREIPAHLDRLWRERDRTAEQHRAAYTALARQVPLPHEALYDALYERHMSPHAWQPYPDAAGVLAALREREVPVAVVSNIGWDLRPVFRSHGLDGYVREYVLSFEHALQKPDPRLFRTACTALGLAPEETLRVGDDRRADGGATALGCAYHPVDHLPIERRPHGLRSLLGGLEAA